jgi:hypothetical protein
VRPVIKTDMPAGAAGVKSLTSNGKATFERPKNSRVGLTWFRTSTGRLEIQSGSPARRTAEAEDAVSIAGENTNAGFADDMVVLTTIPFTPSAREFCRAPNDRASSDRRVITQLIASDEKAREARNPIRRRWEDMEIPFGDP